MKHSVAQKDPNSTISTTVAWVQIYDIETRYLTDANPRGNAVRGEHPCATCCNCLSCSGWSRADPCSCGALFRGVLVDCPYSSCTV